MFKKILFCALLVIFVWIIISYTLESQKTNPFIILSNLYKANPKIYEETKNLSVKEGVYRPRRELTFAVKYMNIIPVGEARIMVEDPIEFKNQKVYPLIAEAQVGSFFAIFYKAKARVESLVSIDKLLPLSYKEQIYVKDDLEKAKQIEFDHDKLLIIRDGKTKIKINKDTFDPISSIFYLRIQDFDTQKDLRIKMISKEATYLLESDVLEKNNGIWRLDSSIGRLDKTSSHGARFSMWVSADSNRLPLLIKVTTKAGTITLRLIGVK